MNDKPDEKGERQMPKYERQSAWNRQKAKGKQLVVNGRTRRDDMDCNSLTRVLFDGGVNRVNINWAPD